MPKLLTARQTPMVSKASAARSKTCFMISPRFLMSAVASACSYSFMRRFWLSGGSCPSLPFETYHRVQGIA